MKEILKSAGMPLLLGSLFLTMNLNLGAADFVGPETCKTCHPSQYDDFILSGHPFKLNKVENGLAPIYPFSEVPNPPEGVSWDDVTYVIGGYGWKARFIDQNGFIITGDAVQYNLATQGWVAYEPEDPLGTKPYNCGKCHTTGWQTTEENGGLRQDDLPGMAGTFAFGGVTCESCHGEGSDHAAAPSKSNIVIDTSKEQCGSCHFRDSEHRIAASGGFVKHHEQFDELINSPHQFMDCVTCHDPHKSTKYEQGGVKETPYCTTCHADMTIAIPEMADFACETCHMPLADKSAVTTGPDGVLGDIHSHTFRLNTEWNAQMFTEDGKFLNLDKDNFGLVTADFACESCHNGVEEPKETKDWMIGNGRTIHTGGRYILEEEADLGGRWKFLDSLGFLNDNDFPWLYSEDHGWMYSHSESLEDILLWNQGLGWVWTSDADYPFLYRFQDQTWLWFDKGSSPRNFFNFTTGKWEIVDGT